MAPLSTFQESFSKPQASDLHLGFLRELQNAMHMALPPPPQYHGTRPAHILDDLGHTSFVYIRHGAHRNPLQSPYAGPFPVLERNEKCLVIYRDSKIEKVTVDHLKTTYMSPMEPLFRPAAASQLPVPTACRHRLGHHSQILQYLFVHEADERSVHETD